MKYSIVDGTEKMNLDEVIRLLRMTYWADKRSALQIEKSMQNSSCYGVRLDDGNKLVGFARVISDYATTHGSGDSAGVIYRISAGICRSSRDSDYKRRT